MVCFIMLNVMAEHHVVEFHPFSLEGGCTFGSLRTSNPTLADDFLYSSLTETGAEKGLKVADNNR